MHFSQLRVQGLNSNKISFLWSLVRCVRLKSQFYLSTIFHKSDGKWSIYCSMYNRMDEWLIKIFILTLWAFLKKSFEGRIQRKRDRLKEKLYYPVGIRHRCSRPHFPVPFRRGFLLRHATDIRGAAIFRFAIIFRCANSLLFSRQWTGGGVALRGVQLLFSRIWLWI
jgi:hypothetical protein